MYPDIKNLFDEVQTKLHRFQDVHLKIVSLYYNFILHEKRLEAPKVYDLFILKLKEVISIIKENITPNASANIVDALGIMNRIYKTFESLFNKNIRRAKLKRSRDAIDRLNKETAEFMESVMLSDTP
jgi:DNA gyrase/topoisomerase IV subunit A